MKPKLKPLALALRVKPTLHFHAVINGEEYVLPLGAEQARTLGATLVLLGDMIDRQESLRSTESLEHVVRSVPVSVN